MAEENPEKKAKPMTLARKLNINEKYRIDLTCSLIGFQVSKNFIWKASTFR
jgi:hypothetical protein